MAERASRAGAPDGPGQAQVQRADRVRDPSRVHWMELFFDLVFVALVAQLAAGLHDEATMVGLVVFLGLFASVWWSWVNLTFAVNVTPWRSVSQLAVVMLLAMFAVGALAVAAPEATTDRAWLFAAGNAMLRVILLGIWIAGSRGDGRASWGRAITYNGVTAAIWTVSIWIPTPWNFALWGVAIILEVVLLVASNRRWTDRVIPRMNVEHLTERFGLLVVIALGESVLSGVDSLSHHWSAASAWTGVLGLATISLLAWSFFMYGITAMREGLEYLYAQRRLTAIRDVIGFLPFFLVAGITAISSAIYNAIAHPDEVLPQASAVALAGGIAAFYFTNGVISVRFGRTVRSVLRWGVPAALVAVAVGVVAFTASATLTLICAVVGLAVIVAIAERGSHHAVVTTAEPGDAKNPLA